MIYSFVPERTFNNIGLTLYKRAQEVSYEVRSELQLHIYTTCKRFYSDTIKLTFSSIICREQSLAMLILIVLTGKK